jgi:superfamily II DNA or RNA helicase
MNGPLVEPASRKSEARSLRELDLAIEYRSDAADLLREFYFPCLERSLRYQRAVGYFTSGGLAAAARGITALIANGGRMQLVASPLFEQADLAAIEEGYEARENIIDRALVRALQAPPDTATLDRFGYLAWLIAEERLEIRIALPEEPLRGIYHEKVGIFTDEHQNHVAYTGSPNETHGGLVANFESIDVFLSWTDPGRVARKRANFDALWENRTPRLRVVPFPDAARDRLLAYRPARPPELESQTWAPSTKTVVAIPEPWGHQVEAIHAWEQAGRRGILAMATGSGKTLTAIMAAHRCRDAVLIIIAVPTIPLVDQWHEEVTSSRLLPPPVRVYGSSGQWQEALFDRLLATRKAGGLVALVGTLDSLSSERFQNTLADARPAGATLLIADEVHNLGARSYRKIMRDDIDYRLGLSATPDRYFDDEGTAALRTYFGGTIFTYDMERALSEGRLVPYDYHLYPAYLTEDETDQFEQLTARIGLLLNHDDHDPEELQQLLFRRARIIKKAETKTRTLAQALQQHPFTRALVYCADHEQLEEAAQDLTKSGQSFITYTSRNTKQERRAALMSLAQGHVPMIVAIDCLDEGIDIPDVDHAFIIASSTNRRQFIQRRGRVLRKAPGKQRATIIDILTLPARATDGAARAVVRGELRRVKDMARLADNRAAALNRVKELTESYGVLMTELVAGDDHA